MPGPAGGIIPYNANDPTQRSLLSMINTSEGSPTHDQGEGYVDLSGAPRDNHGFPVWGGRQGPQGRTHAAGMFQFEPHTWSGIASQHNLDFRKPQDQEAGAWYLAQQVYRQKTGGDLAAAIKRGDTASVRSALAGTWATQKGAGVRSKGGGEAGSPAFDANTFGLSPDEQRMVAQDTALGHAAALQSFGNYAKMGDVYEDEIKALDEESKRREAAYAEFQATEKKLTDSLPDQHKLENQRLLEVSDQPMQPGRVLGQFMPMMAVLLGAFGKAGVVGSLNAAAAAANAARGHDEGAIEKANNDFKNQLQIVMDQSTIVHQRLTEAIAESEGNSATIAQKANIIGAMFNIPHLQQAAMNDDVNSIIAARAAMTKGIVELYNLKKTIADTEKAEAEAKAAGGLQLSPQAQGVQAAIATVSGIPGHPSLFPSGMGMQWNANKVAAAEATTRELIKKYGLDPRDPNAGATAVYMQTADSNGALADKSSLVANSKAVGAAQGFINTMDNVIDLTKSVAQKAAGRFGSQALNRPWMWFLQNFTNDPDVINLNALLGSVADEYGNIRQAAPNTSVHLTVSMAANVEKLVNHNLTLEEMEGLFDTMHKEGEARLSGYQAAGDKSLADLQTKVSGLAGGSVQVGTDEDGQAVYGRPQAQPMYGKPPQANAPTAPTANPAYQGLTGAEKGQWVSDVEELRKWVAGKKGDPDAKAWAIQRLHQEHPDASPQQLNAAFQ
jgi:hypothetical protein